MSDRFFVFLEWKTKRRAASSKTGWGRKKTKQEWGSTERQIEVKIIRNTKKKKKKNQCLHSSSHEHLIKPSSQQTDTSLVPNILSDFRPDVSQVNLWLIKGENPLRDSYCRRVEWQLANDLSGGNSMSCKRLYERSTGTSRPGCHVRCLLSIKFVGQDSSFKVDVLKKKQKNRKYGAGNWCSLTCCI